MTNDEDPTVELIVRALAWGLVFSLWVAAVVLGGLTVVAALDRLKEIVPDVL